MQRVARLPFNPILLTDNIAVNIDCIISSLSVKYILKIQLNRQIGTGSVVASCMLLQRWILY
jgi:hypothetical protein